MPPAAKPRDELLLDVQARLVRVEETLSSLREAMARIEGAEEQGRVTATGLVLRMDGLDTRLTALEAARNRAEGAAAGANWLWKALIAAGLVSGGAVARHLAGK